MNTADTLLSFMKTIEKLCFVNRDNLLTTGGFESDADHSFKLAVLIMMIHPFLKQPVNLAHMLQMALIHDLAEAATGDISLSAQSGDATLYQKKKADEEIAFRTYANTLPAPLGDMFLSLFHEYEKRQTREAQIVYALDKLEASLQANQYHDGDIRYWADCINGRWYYVNVQIKKELIAQLGEEIISDLEQAIITLSQENMKKHHIEIPQIPCP